MKKVNFTIRNTIIAYFAADTKRRDYITFKPGVYVDLKQIDIEILQKIKKACEELSFRSNPKDLAKRYKATMTIKPVWLSIDNIFYEMEGYNNVQIEEKLGQNVLVYSFPIDTLKEDIDNIITKYNIQNHQQICLSL